LPNSPVRGPPSLLCGWRPARPTSPFASPCPVSLPRVQRPHAACLLPRGPPHCQAPADNPAPPRSGTVSQDGLTLRWAGQGARGDRRVCAHQNSSLLWARAPGGEEGGGTGDHVFARRSVKPDLMWPGDSEAQGASWGDTARAELLLLEEQPALCPEPLVDRRSSRRIWNPLRSTCVPRLNRADRLVFVSTGTPTPRGVSSRKRLHETGPGCAHPCGRAPRSGV